jgi:hypothetical protein
MSKPAGLRRKSNPLWMPRAHVGHGVAHQKPDQENDEADGQYLVDDGSRLPAAPRKNLAVPGGR